MMRVLIALLCSTALALPFAVLALPPEPKAATPPAAPAPGVDPAPAGTIPWQLLQQAKTVQKADRKFGPQFTKEIRDLDRQQVRLYGFMMPLDQSTKQKRFLLSAFPPHCAFCMPGGAESLVEVIAEQPIEFTYEPVVLAGKLAVLDDDIVYYRLTNATSVKY